jgi:uncharacterized phiE125 gp8 family phage protein
MLKVITAPDEIITVAEVEEFARAEFGSSEEALIESLITAARQWCEEYLGRAIGVQTLELREAGFPINNGPLVLRCPLISVTSLKYLDSENVETTMDAADYVVSDAEPAMIVPAASWPVAYDCADSVRVVYQAGYYPGGSPVLSEVLPKTIKTAMLMMITDMYDNREAQLKGQFMVNPTLERLLSIYRLGMGI